MRVIAGIYKGFRFDPGKKFSMRPTTDRNREALFNILQHKFNLDEANVLDLFSGAGGVTYECASRGAERMVSVEKNPGLCQFIKNQFQTLDYVNHEVICQDVYSFLQEPSSPEFDLVFADPPYNDPKLGSLPERVFSSGCLKPNGLFVLEHGSNSLVSGAFEQRKYGQSTFSFFKY